MSKGAFCAYANSKAPDQPANLIRDFSIYISVHSILFRDSVNGQRSPLSDCTLHILIWTFALLV